MGHEDDSIFKIINWKGNKILNIQIRSNTRGVLRSRTLQGERFELLRYPLIARATSVYKVENTRAIEDVVFLSRLNTQVKARN